MRIPNQATIRPFDAPKRAAAAAAAKATAATATATAGKAARVALVGADKAALQHGGARRRLAKLHLRHNVRVADERAARHAQQLVVDLLDLRVRAARVRA